MTDTTNNQSIIDADGATLATLAAARERFAADQAIIDEHGAATADAFKSQYGAVRAACRLAKDAGELSDVLHGWANDVYDVQRCKDSKESGGVLLQQWNAWRTRVGQIAAETTRADGLSIAVRFSTANKQRTVAVDMLTADQVAAATARADRDAEIAANDADEDKRLADAAAATLRAQLTDADKARDVFDYIARVYPEDKPSDLITAMVKLAQATASEVRQQRKTRRTGTEG